MIKLTFGNRKNGCWGDGQPERLYTIIFLFMIYVVNKTAFNLAYHLSLFVPAILHVDGVVGAGARARENIEFLDLFFVLNFDLSDWSHVVSY